MICRSVFIIEDDSALREMLVELLTSAGYSTRSFESIFGVAGVIDASPPSAILLDLGLPYRSGASLLQDVKSNRRTAHIPVIVLSGVASLLSGERRALADVVLDKPVDFNRLLQIIDGVCSRPSGSEP